MQYYSKSQEISLRSPLNITKNSKPKRIRWFDIYNSLKNKIFNYKFKTNIKVNSLKFKRGKVYEKTYEKKALNNIKRKLKIIKTEFNKSVIIQREKLTGKQAYHISQ